MSTAVHDMQAGVRDTWSGGMDAPKVRAALAERPDQAHLLVRQVLQAAMGNRSAYSPQGDLVPARLVLVRGSVRGTVHPDR